MNEVSEPGGRTRLCARTAVTAAVLLSGLLGGCAETVTGTERIATPDLSTLDVGELRTHPVTVPSNDNDTHGRVLESARLSEAVINPPDIDPALIYGTSTLLPTPGRVSVLAPEIAIEPIANFGMIAGYTVTGSDVTGQEPRVGEAKAMRFTVLSFRDDDIARMVAGRIDEADIARTPDAVRVHVPGHAGAYAHWRDRSPILFTTLAYRSFVIVVLAADRTRDEAALTTLTANALTAELPLLDAFEPTPPDKLSTMPFDDDAMLRRMLHPDEDRWPYPLADANGTAQDDSSWPDEGWGSGVVYGPRGVSHLLGRSPEGRDSPGAGVERAAFIGSRWLLRLSDPARARAMNVRLTNTSQHEAVTPPSGVPDSACFRNPAVTDAQRESRYYCFVLDGRYWAIVSAADEPTVKQRAAAQYALLVNARTII
ncbi:Uncharacterised protein [Nocardia otitidiscaviarum]|uniref:Uncharacterized protein n=1 Tax=Nocardia otitidiscaviarum TaxID=1823 RepID=A0A378YPL7_9NOCA|nr:hypothetical protein [Nocardia otitidiscaviarum]SUA78713.1 Uncharacterised protein [Nocardia otitidiscaviarum]